MMFSFGDGNYCDAGARMIIGFVVDVISFSKAEDRLHVI